MKVTSADYINNIDFEYFETYSFQRNGNYDILNELHEKRKDARLNPEENKIYDRAIASTQKVPNVILDDAGKLNETAILITTVSKESQDAIKLIEILQTPIKMENHWMCLPVYRDAILFYNAKNERINGINICLECDAIESIDKHRIPTDYKTFKHLKQFLLSLGHNIENPEYFKADEIDALAEKYKNE